MEWKAWIMGGLFGAGFLLLGGGARAEIDVTAPVVERGTLPFAADDEKSCLAAGGVWVTTPPHCDATERTASEDMAWDWTTFGEGAEQRALASASAWRAYFEGRVRAPKLYAKPFLLTTASFVARCDASIARAAKADTTDKASKDPSAPKRIAARARAVSVWAALRADVIAVDAAVRKKLAQASPPKPTVK